MCIVLCVLCIVCKRVWSFWLNHFVDTCFHFSIPFTQTCICLFKHWIQFYIKMTAPKSFHFWELFCILSKQRYNKFVTTWKILTLHTFSVFILFVAGFFTCLNRNHKNKDVFFYSVYLLLCIIKFGVYNLCT